MKKYMLSLSVVLFWAFSMTAQSNSSAVRVLENMVNLIENNAIKTDFGLVVKQAGSDDLQRMKGSFLLHSDKFALTTSDMDVFFDGTTQWAYAPSINEVTLTNPTDKELAETNPLALLSSYKANSTIRFMKNEEHDSHLISLTPTDADSDVKTIIVKVMKANNSPKMVQLYDKKGGISTISMRNFRSNITVTPADFVFNPALYEDIEINDLR